MNMREWEAFIHGGQTVGCRVRIVVPAGDREQWPVPDAVVSALQDIEPGSSVIQFDASIPDGTVGTVVEISYCGWLHVEIADHGVIPVPGWYLQPVEREWPRERGAGGK